jgi:hypothetical protein
MSDYEINPIGELIDFEEPIYLPSHVQYVAPYLQEPAILHLSNEPLLIIPEQNPIVPQLQDYKLIAVNSLYRHMVNAGKSVRSFTDEIKHIDFMYVSDGNALPPGVAVIRYGEQALIGRETTPQLELPGHVSALHAQVSPSAEGLLIVDLGSSNGTSLSLSQKDTEDPLPAVMPEMIGTSLRDDLLRAFDNLSNDGRISIYDSGLDIGGGYVNINDSPYHCIELLIRRADDYPEIKPLEGYSTVRIRLDPTVEGGDIYRMADVRDAREPGIISGDSSSQINVRQAKELMRIALTV